MSTVNEIIEKLKTLTLLEASELVSQIEETFGVDASAPVGGGVMMAAMPAGGAAEAAPKEEEKTLFDECQKISERLKKDITKKIDENALKRDKFSLLRSELLLEFDKFTSSTNKQQRGLLLEDLLKRIFSLYDIPTQKSFSRNEGGEQIDAAFKLESWYYLVECKWTEKLTNIRQLDSLSGKISRSGKPTLGLFLSINGWSKNVCPLLKQNTDKSIILMDGFDLRCVLVEHNELDLNKLLLKKLEHLNFEGEPFYSAAEFIKSTKTD